MNPSLSKSKLVEEGNENHIRSKKKATTLFKKNTNSFEYSNSIASNQI
ncbi:15280_t:CDS:1, partial [Gigaspora margarita]